MSSGSKRKRSRSSRVTEAGRQSPGDRREHVMAVAEERVTAALDLRRIDLPRAQEEAHLLARAVTREQLAPLRRALHEDRARNHALRRPARFPPRRAAAAGRAGPA